MSITCFVWFYFQLFGLFILGVGIWAWTEKDIFNNISRLTNVALDPAFVLAICGFISFIIGFCGALGALRENTCLLATYSMFLAVLLLMEMSLGVLAFVLKDKGWVSGTILQVISKVQTFILVFVLDKGTSY